MTLIVENVSDDLAKAIRSIAKIANAKVKTQKPKNKGGALREALKELENGECETFKNFAEYKKAMANV